MSIDKILVAPLFELFVNFWSTSIAGFLLSAVKVLDIFFVDISRGEIGAAAEPGFDSVCCFYFEIAVVVVDRRAVGVDWMGHARNAFKTVKFGVEKNSPDDRKRQRVPFIRRSKFVSPRSHHFLHFRVEFAHHYGNSNS